MSGMASMCQKIKVALDETRMLVLGTQVLISLQFQLVFQRQFATVSGPVQDVVVVGLVLLLAAFALLLWGPAYHRIVATGECTQDSHGFMTWATCAAMWPLGLALGLDAFIAFNKFAGPAVGIAAGIVFCAICWSLWRGLSLIGARSKPPEVQAMKNSSRQSNPDEQPELHERVNQALTEARVVLPGAQAMLGFQLVTMFTEAFDALPATSKGIHLGSLALIALTVVLLMTPAAFHRIAEAGEDSERLVKLTGRFVLAAMIPLATGMAGDLFVIVRKITDSTQVAAGAATLALALALGMWFGYPFYRRRASVPRELAASPAHSR
jgi:hypothetical protein